MVGGVGGEGGGGGGATKMSHGMLQREILKLINIYAVQGGKYMTVNILLKFHGTKEFYLLRSASKVWINLPKSL